MKKKGRQKTPGPKTIKKDTNSTPNKSQTQRARTYKVTSFLSTDCELSTNPCSRFLYSLGPWRRDLEVGIMQTERELATTGEDRPGQDTVVSSCAWPMLRELPMG